MLFYIINTQYYTTILNTIYSVFIATLFLHMTRENPKTPTTFRISATTAVLVAAGCCLPGFLRSVDMSKIKGKYPFRPLVVIPSGQLIAQFSSSTGNGNEQFPCIRK